MNQPPGPVPRCTRCGTLLSTAVAEGLCPSCLTRAVFSTDTPAWPGEDDLPERPERIGDYELVERIARGGMGIVYRARQISLNREVAVKVLLDQVFASPEELARFRAEASSAAALHHPNIVAVHEIGESGGRRFFSMDFVAGKDLAALTREGPLPAREAASLVQKIAEAIHHCHERGVVHRDLKPSNVLVDAWGEPHVTDFGLAKRMGNPPARAPVSSASTESQAPLTITGQVIGTPGYMSPEQATARRDVGPPTDIYSLGALLYHLLTGRAPFIGETPTMVLRQVEEQEPIAPNLFNPAVPRDLVTICLKCLSKEAARRYATAVDLANDLGRFLRHEPILARPITPAERAMRWCRRNPVVASLAAVVALLLLTVAAGSIVSARRMEKERRAENGLRIEAETRLRQGESLINFMLGDLADRLEPVGRLDVLESAISQVDQFYHQIPAERLSPESQRHRANTLFQFGGIRAYQGRLPEAISNYQAAISAYTKLIGPSGTNLQWRYELARTRNDLGIVYARQRDFTNATAQLDQSLRERETLFQLEPTNFIWLAGCGAAAQNLGVIQRRLGHYEQSGEYLEHAERAFRTWIAADPSSTTAKERLATVRGSVGQLLEANNKPDAAAAAYADKVGILRDLLKEDPKHTRRQADLVIGISYVAELQIQQSNYVAALTNVSEGVRLGEELVAHDPANREWLACLVTQLTDSGLVLRALNRPEDALKSFRRACELSEAQGDRARQYPEWRNNWLQALEVAAELEREQAQTATARGQTNQAAEHTRAAEELERKHQALAKP